MSLEIRVVVDPGYAALFNTFIKRELKFLRVRGMRVYYKEKPAGFFRCRMAEPRFFGRVDRMGFKKAVANSVAALVIARWECFFGPALIRRVEWTGAEIDWERVCARLNKNRPLIGGLRQRVLALASDHLTDSTNLDVAGFVRFRLPDVSETIAEALAVIVDEQLFEQENEEFIRILRCYTAKRNRHPDTVHVVIEAGSRFRLYDEDFKDFTQSLEHEVPLLDDEVRNEDLLIAVLLTLSPENIVLHGKRCLPVTRETLERVFGPAVSVCKGCDRCAVWVKA